MSVKITKSILHSNFQLLRWMDGWVGGWMDGWMEGQMDGWTDMCIDKEIDRQIDNDRQTEGNIGGQTDRQKHRQKESYNSSTLHLQLQLHYTKHPAVVGGKVTTATIATTSRNRTPTASWSISGCALPSMHHNHSSLPKRRIFETSATAFYGTTNIIDISVVNTHN